jgi:hypothetical protein
MRKTLVITDLTQMPTWDRVCIVGIDDTGLNIRPVYFDGKGVPKRFLFQDKRLIVFPGARVEFELSTVKFERPHIEDKGFDPAVIVYKNKCNPTEWQEVLKRSSYAAVEEIFEGSLNGNWVKKGNGPRSIATLREAAILNVHITPKDSGAVSSRLTIKDGNHREYDLPISDLAFKSYCFHKVKKEGVDSKALANHLSAQFGGASQIYLRIGLARSWEEHPERCYMQVTGIYTFSDYLEGRTFADYI